MILRYEYKKIVINEEYAAKLLECYENFGWTLDQKNAYQNSHYIMFRMKRDRRIMNRTELTRLQRHFETCLVEISKLEQSKISVASAGAMAVGIFGAAFMVGAGMALTDGTPNIGLAVLAAIPGIIGLIMPYFLYQSIMGEQAEKVQPLIEDKYKEIDTICEKGRSLL